MLEEANDLVAFERLEGSGRPLETDRSTALECKGHTFIASNDEA
jgi:hypothetical protein